MFNLLKHKNNNLQRKDKMPKENDTKKITLGRPSSLGYAC